MANKPPKTFAEMTQEERAALFEAWFQGNKIEYYESGTWYITELPYWRPNSAYRIALRKPSINWSHVAPKYKWLARDKQGKCWLLTQRPFEGKNDWLFCNFETRMEDQFASFDPGTCDWRESLVRRPEVTDD